MKRMRCFLCMALTAVSLLSLSVSASAADYSFETDGTPEYYPSTSYEEVYGSQYNYGSKNLVDYQVPELSYGTMSTTQTGVMEKILLPGLQASVSTSVQGGYGIVGDGLYVPSLPVVSGGVQYQTPAYTSADGMERKDGSIGTVKIPTLDISMKVWEGETTASMAKGLGHYSSTSAWDGNVCICGHNRGAKYVIGSIKDLEIGDIANGDPIEGVTYKIEQIDGDYSTSATTDSTGRIYLENIPVGSYKITEVNVPDYVILSEVPQTVSLEAGCSRTVTFFNALKPSLTILKRNSVTTEPLENAKFHIYYASDNTDTGEINDLGVYYSDADGKIMLTDVNRGWYKIVEEAAPDGYSIQGDGVMVFYLEANTSKTVTVDNVPLNAIIVEKYDSVTGEVLPGCTFQLRYLSGTSGTGGTVIGQKTTGKTGTVTWTGLSAGTYREVLEAVEETQEPPIWRFQNGGEGGCRTAQPAAAEPRDLRPSKKEKRKNDLSQKEVSQSVPRVTAQTDGQTDEEEELMDILDACELDCFSPETARVFENAIERLFYSDSFRIGNATLPKCRVRAKLRLLDGMILREAEGKLAANLEQNVKNSTAYTMATIFNCIAEGESDLMVDPYLNSLRAPPARR